MKKNKVLVVFITLFVLFQIGVGINLLIENYYSKERIEKYFLETKNEYDSLVLNNDEIKTILAHKLYYNYYNYATRSFDRYDKDIFDINIQHTENNIDYTIGLYSKYFCKDSVGSIIDYKNSICLYNLYYILEYNINGKKTLFSRGNLLISSEITLSSNKYNISYNIYDNNEKEQLGFNVIDVVKQDLKRKIYVLNDLEYYVEQNKSILRYFK